MQKKLIKQWKTTIDGIENFTKTKNQTKKSY